MIITKLDKVGTKQVRLFFDEEKYCLLYYNEIRRLGFHEQDEIGQEEFEGLFENHEPVMHNDGEA